MYNMCENSSWVFCDVIVGCRSIILYFCESYWALMCCESVVLMSCNFSRSQTFSHSLHSCIHSCINFMHLTRKSYGPDLLCVGHTGPSTVTLRYSVAHCLLGIRNENLLRTSRFCDARHTGSGYSRGDVLSGVTLFGKSDWLELFVCVTH